MGWLLQTDDDWALTIIRLRLEIVYFPHGDQKLLGWFGRRGISATITSCKKLYNLPAIFVIFAIGAEFFGYLGLVSGCLARIAAFWIAVDMLVGIKIVTLKNGFFVNWACRKPARGLNSTFSSSCMAMALVWKDAGAVSLD